MNRRFALGLLVIVLAALALRMPRLDLRPMHNDEAVNAIKFRDLWEKGHYVYDPHEYHGPTLHYATLASARLYPSHDYDQFTEATFRVVGYGMSPFIFMVFPVCGMPITWVWTITLAIIGLREAHETSGGKAAVAVLFPFIMCCGIITMTIALFMGAVAASFGTMMNWYQ